MAKLHNPLFSLSSWGRFSKLLSVRRSQAGPVLEKTPIPTDARTSGQLAWRTMFQLAVDLWHSLSSAEKLSWESAARPYHMTGYAYFLSQALRPNPGIYLPLAGGTMQGSIDMASNKLENLPAAAADAEPSRKVDLTSHAAAETGIHGLLGEVSFSVYQTSSQLLSNNSYTIITWDVEEWDIGGYFDLANNRFKPLIPGKYHFDCAVRLTGCANNGRINLYLYKNTSIYRCIGITQTVNYGYPTVNGSCICDLNGTSDYVQIRCYLSSTTGEYTHAVDDNVWFQGFLLPQS